MPQLRYRALDAAMAAARLRISQARTPEDVARLRARRTGALQLPLLGALLERGGERLFGRPHPDVAVEDLTVPGPAGDLTVRFYRPAVVRGDTPLVVHLHGGGWVLGDLDGYDWLCSEVAQGADVVVASVEYRLAPEHPAPAAVEDAVAAVRWLAEHRGELGAGGGLGVMGDSAGGNLAVLSALALRQLEGPTIDAQVLIYPALDLTRSFPSHRELADAPLLSADEISAFLAHYLRSGAEADDPALSPWHATDLTGLPPTLLQTAELDPLRDEGRAFAARLGEAGTTVRWTEYVGAPHGYVSLPGLCPAGPQAAGEIVQFLRRTL